MIPREIPGYLEVAYSLRYSDVDHEESCLGRIWQAVQRVFSLIQEIICYQPLSYDFLKNRVRLEKDFGEIVQTVVDNEKPLCMYFVSAQDHNGAILGDSLYYYHHYKIQNLQKHFAVAPKVVASQDQMKEFMREIKQQYPQREIKFVDVVCHGRKSSLLIRSSGQAHITPDQLREDLFEDSAPDATILLDACTSGLGDRNIADEIARKTPGRTILAPAPSMYFSKPIIQTENDTPRVVSAVHGFAIFNAYTCKSFSYTERMPSRYPYIKDEALKDDILSIASFPILQNSWLDPYLNEENEEDKQQVIRIFDRLSKETRDFITKQVSEKNGSSIEHGESFLRESPLDTSVRLAFRSVFNELLHEVRDYPSVSLLKTALYAQNVFQVMSEFFQNLCQDP